MDRIPNPSGIADKMRTKRRHRVTLFLLETLRSDEIAGMLTRVSEFCPTALTKTRLQEIVSILADLKIDGLSGDLLLFFPEFVSNDDLHDVVAGRNLR